MVDVVVVAVNRGGADSEFGRIRRSIFPGSRNSEHTMKDYVI